MQESSQLKIWIDADACPRAVKEVIFKASFRLKVPVCLVPNSYMAVPPEPLITFIKVEKGAIATNPRGELYTEENTRERLSMRDFMRPLRDSGVDTGGPSPFGPKDKERFANSVDRILALLMK
jgi:hypothetical protein